ncbi:MAG TPA: hypothetical protein VF529_04095 [Solirubrobacteraceae bacterium]|jgi:hypothetical protein
MRARDVDAPGAPYGLAAGVVGIGGDSERRAQRLGEVDVGSFVWTRAPDGAYFLGRVRGPLRRDDSADAREVGMVFVRDTEWLDRPFPDDEVPAAVAATFARGGRNLQRMHSEAAERWTAELWETWRR